MRHQSVIAMAVQQMTCTGCGAEANASCNCGKPYVPKKQRAAEALAQNSNRSDGAIAKEIGVDRSTVTRARAESGSADAPPEREGRDGKVYRLPVRVEEDEPDGPEEIKESFFSLVDMALRISDLDLSSVADPKINEAIEGVINAWVNAQRRLK